MKKLFALLVVLALCGAANAGVVSLTDAGGTIVASGGAEVTITVEGANLLSVDVLLTVSGDATISGYMTNSDSADYGWDPVGFPITPIVGTGNVEIGGGNFMGNVGPRVVGYITVIYGSGEVTVTMEGAYSFGGSYDISGMYPADVTPGGLTILPEPMTIALLGLGGLFIRRRK